MSQQYINIGATPNDGLGDPIRTAFQKTNENFSELYANSGNGGGNANTGNVTFDNINIIGTGNLHLQPDANNAGAFLDVYLTTGPDIHIAGNGENVIIGRDDGANVTVGVFGNVTIQANNGTAQTWTFGTNGALTFPEGNTSIVRNPDTGRINFDAGVDGGGGISFGPTSNTYITGSQAVGIQAGFGNETAYNWTFGTDGQIYLPDGTTMGAVEGINTFGFYNSNANTQFLIELGSSNAWDFDGATGSLTLPTSGNLVLAGGVIKGNGGSPAPSINGFDTISALTLSATGNIQGNYLFGNGTFLTGISGAGNPSANALTGNTLTANVTTSSLTQVGTLGNLSVSGNTTSGNLITSGLVSVTGNAQAGNLLTVGIVSSTGNAVHGNILTAGLISSTGNAIAGNILTGGFVSATGNIIATNFIGNLSNGNSKISIASSGNITVGIGPFDTTVLNINTSTGISVLGNVVASQAISAVGNVYSNGNIAMVSNLPRNTYVANVAPTVGQGNIGDIWYQTF